MPFRTMNMLCSRVTPQYITDTGTGTPLRGIRLGNLQDVQYVNLNYRVEVMSGVGDVQVRMRWRPSTIDGVTAGVSYDLTPLGPIVSNGDGAKNLSSGWIEVDPAVREEQYVMFRTGVYGTPGLDYALDFCTLMFR